VVRERGRRGLGIRRRVRGGERQGDRDHNQPVRRYRDQGTPRDGRYGPGGQRPGGHRGGRRRPYGRGAGGGGGGGECAGSVGR